MAEDVDVPVTEEGVPIIPSDTVFREKIMEGKTPELAQEFAMVAGEARANTFDGFVRYKLSLGWKKIMAALGLIISTAIGSISVLGTAKIQAVIEALFNH